MGRPPLHVFTGRCWWNMPRRQREGVSIPNTHTRCGPIRWVTDTSDYRKPHVWNSREIRSGENEVEQYVCGKGLGSVVAMPTSFNHLFLLFWLGIIHTQPLCLQSRGVFPELWMRKNKPCQRYFRDYFTVKPEFSSHTSVMFSGLSASLSFYFISVFNKKQMKNPYEQTDAPHYWRIWKVNVWSWAAR